MGPSPASASSSQMRPPFFSASSTDSLSAADEWFLANSERDAQILTQALTRELSTPALPGPSASSSLCETLIDPSLKEQGFERQNWSQALHCVRSLQQKQKQQHEQQMQTGPSIATAEARKGMPCMQRQQDGFHSSLQRGSPSSSNSQFPFTASNPGSPYSNSTITTTNSAMSMPTDSLVAHMKPSTPLHQGAQEGLRASSIVSHNVPSCKSVRSSRTASMACLSSQAALGAAENKVSKRRSRALGNRAPMSVLMADVSNFRAMVQQLTGIPSSNPSSMHSLHGTSSLLKPHPTKHQYTDTENLPTLDTSACFFGPKPTMKEPFQGLSSTQRSHWLSSNLPSGVVEPGSMLGRNAGCIPQTDIPLYAKQTVFGDKTTASSSPTFVPSQWDYASTAKSRENFASVMESQPYSTKPGTDILDECLPSWLCFDGVFNANHAPGTDLARMA